jgi:hypothetical protein
VRARAWNYIAGVKTFELHWFGVELVGLRVGYFYFGIIFACAEAQIILRMLTPTATMKRSLLPWCWVLCWMM